MKRMFRMITMSAVVLSLNAIAKELDTAGIEQAIGMKGTLNTNENVFKVTFPRKDVKVAVDGWSLPPFMGLASWAAFTPGGMMERHDMVMSDTVVFQDEVNPAMSVALDNGLAVTALHNHFFYDEPKVYFMHLEGEGDANRLAASVKKVWDKIKEIRATNPEPGNKFGFESLPEKSSITQKPVEDALGAKAQATDGMVKVVIGHSAKMEGTRIGKGMGVNTWAAFAGSDDNAVVDGDFAVQEDELQPVLKSLRHDSINILAIHSHMAMEKPRILFLHYWGRGHAVDLAKAVKSALDQTKESRHSDFSSQ